MLLSTQTDVTAVRYGTVKSIRLLAEAGFDAIDFSFFDCPERAWAFGPDFQITLNEAAKAARECGVTFNQAHAPFPTVRSTDAEYTRINRQKVIRSIQIAGELGAKAIVIHPACFETNQMEQNIEMYNSFLPYAKQAGIKIALENMWGWDNRRGTIRPNVCSVAEELAAYHDALDSQWFTVCLDLGHIGLVGEYEKPFITALGHERLTCLHVHDNDYVHDSHVAPFMGKLPWNEIAQGLAQIHYSGDLTLEADNTIKDLPDEMMKTGLKWMHDSGRQLIKMIQKYEEELK